MIPLQISNKAQKPGEHAEYSEEKRKDENGTKTTYFLMSANV